MPSPKRPKKSGDLPGDGSAWQVIVEEIKSQNRLTIATINRRADLLEQRLDEGFGEICARLHVLARVAQGDGNDDDVAKLVPLEDRVAALERRPA